MPKNPVLFPIKKIELTLYNGKVKIMDLDRDFIMKCRRKSDIPHGALKIIKRYINNLEKLDNLIRHCQSVAELAYLKHKGRTA